MIILNNSTVYTGWRHVFFIFPSMILLTVNLMYLIHKKLIKKKRSLLESFLLFIIGINLFSLTKFHPYQNNFFNVLFEKKS